VSLETIVTSARSRLRRSALAIMVRHSGIRSVAV
jgi:hypothetical protein